jgi:hypothetical protein
MATRKIKTNKNKKTFRRTRSKQHRGGSGKKRPIDNVYSDSDSDSDNGNGNGNGNGTPHTIIDGLSFTEQMDDILSTGKVGEKIEYSSNSKGRKYYKIIMNDKGEKAFEDVVDEEVYDTNEEEKRILDENVLRFIQEFVDDDSATIGQTRDYKPVNGDIRIFELGFNPNIGYRGSRVIKEIIDLSGDYHAGSKRKSKKSSKRKSKKSTKRKSKKSNKKK